jgi:hypothetical protein
MEEFVRIAAYLNIALEIVLLGRLAQLRLFGTYRYFSLYLAFSVANGVAATLFNHGSRAYLLFWVAVTPVGVIILLAAALELYSLMIRGFVGLGKWGSLVLIVAAGIGMGIAAVVGLLDSNALHLAAAPTVIAYCKRWVLSAIAVLLLLSSWFFFRFEYMMTRNLVIHSRILTTYCLINAASALSLNLHIKPVRVDAVSLVGAAICFCLWITLLSHKGEESAAPPVTPEEMERTLRMQERISGALGLPRPDRDDRGSAGVKDPGE